ncbi:hypothetical protein QTN25_008361 [Entamoeba marina]
MNAKKHQHSYRREANPFQGIEDLPQTGKITSEDDKRNVKYNRLSGNHNDIKTLINREKQNKEEMGCWIYCPIEPQQVKVEPIHFITKMLYDFQ